MIIRTKKIIAFFLIVITGISRSTFEDGSTPGEFRIHLVESQQAEYDTPQSEIRISFVNPDGKLEISPEPRGLEELISGLITMCKPPLQSILEQLSPGRAFQKASVADKEIDMKKPFLDEVVRVIKANQIEEGPVIITLVSRLFPVRFMEEPFSGTFRLGVLERGNVTDLGPKEAHLVDIWDEAFREMTREGGFDGKSFIDSIKDGITYQKAADFLCVHLIIARLTGENLILSHGLPVPLPEEVKNIQNIVIEVPIIMAEWNHLKKVYEFRITEGKAKITAFAIYSKDEEESVDSFMTGPLSAALGGNAYSMHICKRI